MRGRRLSRTCSRLSAFILALLLMVSSQVAYVSEPDAFSEVMPYDVLCGPEPPQFAQVSSELQVGSSDTALDRAYELILAGRLVETLDLLDSAGYTEGASPRADYYRVLALCGTKRLDDAVELVQSLFEDQAYAGLAHYALGCAYLNQSGLYDSSSPASALAQFEKAWNLLPDASGLAFYLGLTHYELGEYARAAEMLEVAVERDESLAQGYLNLGFALARLGETQAALDALHNAAQLGHDHRQACMAIGDLYFELGDFEAAASCYKVVSDEGFLSAQYKLSLALLLSGEVEEAKAVAEELVSAYPKHFDGWITLGRARQALGEIEGAIEAFESALWLRPGHFSVRLHLASACLAASEIDRAKSYVEEALDIYGGDAVAYRLLAEILEAQGDMDGAREAVRKSVQIDPSDALARSLYERLI